MSPKDRLAQRVRDSLAPIEGFAKAFYLFLVGLIVVFSIATCSISTAALDGGTIFLVTLATSLVVAAASSGVGCMLGFLFGIPRSLQGKLPVHDNPVPGTQTSISRVPTSAATRAFLSNTSLEEISDWLTKIIIGLGLVQFHLLIDYLYRAAIYAGSFVANLPVNLVPTDGGKPHTYDAEIAVPFYFALIVVALIAGCLFAYLETRTRLLMLLLDAESANKDGYLELAEEADRPVAVPVPSHGSSQPPGHRNPPSPPAPARATSQDVVVASSPRPSDDDVKALVGWASAQARTGNLDQAETVLREALSLNPNDQGIKERLIEVLKLKNDMASAIRMAFDVALQVQNPDQRYSQLKSALLEALYIAPPQGYELAIEISEKLLALPKAKKDATAHIWAACALGQKFKHLSEQAEAQSVLDAIADDAYELIRKAIEIGSGEDLELIEALYNSVGEDDDLRVFKSERFDDLIYRKSGR
jgi:tetratricopeptide (TPR) repeat protein